MTRPKYPRDRPLAQFYKVYCYRGKEKQIWYEAEDIATGQGIAWSPSATKCAEKVDKLGYDLTEFGNMVIKLYRAKAS